MLNSSGCIPWGMVLVFLNDFLSNEGGFSVQTATAVVFSFAVGIAMFYVYVMYIFMWLVVQEGSSDSYWAAGLDSDYTTATRAYSVC